MKKLTYDEIATQRFSSEQLKHEIRFPIYAIIENMRSAYNVGSVFRSSDGARIKKLFLCGTTPYPPHNDVEKTALGSTLTVPWEYSERSIDVATRLKSQGVSLCIVEHTNKSIPYYCLTKKNFPLCLIIGNEISGVSNELIASADFAIEIPMYGMKQSLNAANAYSIVAFDALRVWKESSGKEI